MIVLITTYLCLFFLLSRLFYLLLFFFTTKDNKTKNSWGSNKSVNYFLISVSAVKTEATDYIIRGSYHAHIQLSQRIQTCCSRNSYNYCSGAAVLSPLCGYNVVLQIMLVLQQ